MQPTAWLAACDSLILRFFLKIEMESICREFVLKMKKCDKNSSIIPGISIKVINFKMNFNGMNQPKESHRIHIYIGRLVVLTIDGCVEMRCCAFCSSLIRCAICCLSLMQRMYAVSKHQSTVAVCVCVRMVEKR